MSRARLEASTKALFRIVIGLLFLCHGLATVFGLLGGTYDTGKAMPAGQWPGWWAALIQIVTGATVILGLATRPTALLASGSMAYAYFTVHQEKSLWPIQNGGEMPVLFCWSFLLIAVLGPGAYALDTLIVRRWPSIAKLPALRHQSSRQSTSPRLTETSGV